MRKAALAIALTLLLTLATPPLSLVNTSPPGASTYPSYAPTATDFVYPVGNPRAAPTYDKGNANGFYISQMFNNSCDPSLGQGFFYAGEYFCGHTGVDLSDMQEGDPVHAVANGLVVFAGYNSSYGEMVRIQHLLPDGTYVYSQYEHMISGSLLVGANQVVTMGQVIGRVGSTGFVTGPHLHFEMKSVNEDGPGYTFGNAALIVGYDDPIAYVSSHTLSQLPTATATAIATATTPATSPTPQPDYATFTPAATPAVSSSVDITSSATETATTTLSPTTPVSGTEVISPTTSVSGTDAISATSNGAVGEAQHLLSNFNTHYRSYVSVTTDQVNVRSGSGFQYSPLNSVQRGARLGYLGVSGDGWVHVALPGNVTGYIARQFVEGGQLPKLPPVVMTPTSRPPFVTVLDARYPARNGPLMRDMAIEPLWVGEKLTYLEREKSSPSWDKVILPSGRIGYILNWYLKGPRGEQSKADVGGGSHTEKISGGKPIVTKPVAPIKGPFVVTTVDNLNLRRGPRLGASRIESLAAGTKLQLRGYHVSWAAVKAPDGTLGYVLGSYVKPLGAADAAPDSRGRTRGGHVNRVRPHVVATVAPAIAATPTPRATPVATPIATSAPRTTRRYVVVAVPAANVHNAPDLKAAVIISAYKDERLTVRNTRGAWALVTTSKGVTGWIMRNLTR